MRKRSIRFNYMVAIGQLSPSIMQCITGIWFSTHSLLTIKMHHILHSGETTADNSQRLDILLGSWTYIYLSIIIANLPYNIVVVYSLMCAETNCSIADIK